MILYEKNAYRIFEEDSYEDHRIKKGTVEKIKEIYMEAFPKQERKPFFVLKHSVKSKIRSRETGSFLMQEICKYFSGKKVVLLIERPDETARNQEQRIARRRFYFKNGFTSSGIFTKGAGGDMEILNFGGQVSPDRYLALQKYALGSLFFRLSKIQIVK